MDRLTNADGIWRTPIDSETVNKLYKRLAAYEDTGLTPEEIHALSDDLFSNYNEVTPAICRGIELWKAEADGRLIVLPCKAGDKVRDLIGNYVFTIEKIVVLDNTLIFKCGNPGTQDYMSFDNQDIGERVEILRGKEAHNE